MKLAIMLFYFPLPPVEGLVGFEDAPNDLLEDVTLLVRPTTFIALVGVVRAMVGDTPGGVATLIVIVPKRRFSSQLFFLL